MNIQAKNNNKRLLEALDYVDVKYVEELVGALRIPKEKHTEAAMTWRTPLKHWKSIAVLAACTVLLAFAAPTASFISQVISNYSSVAGGNAGAGTSELEMPTTAESEVIDSPYERSIYAYPEGMSAEEIYEDVLKGGWVVNIDREIVGGDKYWEEFLRKTNNKTDVSVLIADYEENREAIFLKSVSYDGVTYSYEERFVCQPENEDHISSRAFKYLVFQDVNAPGYEWTTPPGTEYIWLLTDYPDIPFLQQLIPYLYEGTDRDFLDDNATWRTLIHLGN